MADASLWGLMLVCAVVTFALRGTGLWLSRLISLDGRAMRLLACIAYATLAALVSRILFLPAGILETTSLWERLLATAVALGVFLLLGMNLLAGVVTGGVALVVIVVLFGL
ncbi:MAG TPA: AzlD domain-containing protein [Kiloniellales bacterium]|nr:AzlD domain-containing protein [Kiloniellales bacterium]